MMLDKGWWIARFFAPKAFMAVPDRHQENRGDVCVGQIRR